MANDIRGAQLTTPSGKPLRGLYPIVETPFTAEDVLDTDALATLAVQDHGRKKPFTTFAQEALLTMAGTSALPAQPDIGEGTLPITANDVILEIGCGIGRVGRVLSQECLHWVGSDISGEMLKHAAHHLWERPNTTLVELATVGLMEFPRDSFDLVYCTVVFMHLLPWDRYRYVEEAFRVLRPGGHCYFDNVPMDSEHGWRVFLESASYPLERRPAHMSMNSTREELATYLGKAGFANVAVRDLSNGFIAATGRKPE